MAGRIPQQFIEQLLNQADIVDVINARVPLKKKGREYVACCPFHNEKTPSFTVSPSKQFYHCFGCGAHGTAISFLMEYEHAEFVEAVETLAAELRLDVPRESGSQHREEDSKDLFGLLAKSTQLYQSQLRQHPRAIEYLKKRGLDGETVRDFQIGFAPTDWDFILKRLGDSRQRILDLVKTGLLIEKQPGRYYDRFRDRIIFPIRDRRGRVIGFGGRIIDQGEPKYLNSPETPLFHKGRELYGLFEARQAVRKLERIVVVEGYMDVVALAQHGIQYAVATLGTACTPEQIQRLFRTVSQVFFCFDGDRAGRQAAWRALENTLPVLRDDVEARFLFLPEGEDPDSLVRKEGREGFEKRLAQALPLSEFMIDNLTRQVNMGNLDGRAKLAELTKPLLAKLSEGVFKQLLSEQLAKIVGLTSLSSTGGRETTKAPRPADNRQDPHQIKITPSRLAVALLLQQPGLAAKLEIPEVFQHSTNKGIQLLLALHQRIHQQPQIVPAALLENWRNTAEENSLIKLMQWEIPGSENEEHSLKLLKDAVQRLQQHHREQRLESLLEKAAFGTLTDAEKQELQNLSKNG